jgi:hypothetical protein
MSTAIIGVGNIGGAVARHLAAGGESVLVAARDESTARALAHELGPNARADTVESAIAAADTIVLALWLDTMREVISQNATLLDGKVVIDPSNPIGFDTNGQIIRTLPNDRSSGSIVAAALPAGAHYVKAFGTLAADALAASANREPRRAALLYATDDEDAATTIERLIRAAGSDPLKIGGAADAGRIEAPGGDLHQFGFNGEILDLDQAEAALAAAPQA